MSRNDEHTSISMQEISAESRIRSSSSVFRSDDSLSQSSQTANNNRPNSRSSSYSQPLQQTGAALSRQLSNNGSDTSSPDFFEVELFSASLSDNENKKLFKKNGEGISDN